MPPPHFRPSMPYVKRESEGPRMIRHPSIIHPKHEDLDRYHHAAPPPMGKQKKGKNAKKTDGKQPTFLTKLYE